MYIIFLKQNARLASEWCYANFLKGNLAKCRIMAFGKGGNQMESIVVGDQRLNLQVL